MVPFRGEKSLKGPYEGLGGGVHDYIETGRMRGLVLIRSMS